MRRIGLLGGMSWESTAVYYRLINELVRDELGGLHSADCVIRSIDFAEIEELQRAERWEAAGARLALEARALQAAGGELLVLCTNTMHTVAEPVEAAVSMEFVHIADATAEQVRETGCTRVGLLATRYTTEQDFYVGRLRDRHGLEVLVPDPPDRQMVHDVIYDELCVGVVSDRSRDRYRAVMQDLQRRGAEAVILGCTEIGMLVGDEDADVPVFDTAVMHARAAVRRALAGCAPNQDPHRSESDTMKSMTCRQLGGPCDLAHQGMTADEVIKAQDTHLKEVVAQGDTAHEPALKEMKGRWRHPVSGMGWYRQAKRDFEALPTD